MADARWNRAKQVFHEAIEKSGPERALYVAAACGDDRELRAQVEGLLAAHDEAGNFMASPTGSAAADDVARAAAGLAASGAPEAPGTSVGPYKLLQVIGEGGFGIVYMAEQEHPIRRRVALKIIKLGMDTKEVIARFEAERQALAMMDHPNIAKVLDAGATGSGRPYFVMELVKGVPITDYCDANHLSTRERLDLFTDVCKAIHHAHEKGIIHRDIKPSNVMVTLHDGTPVPMIIDFGVAKATNQRLTEKTLFTAYGQFVGTPAYMSPEQTELSGLEIDRRSDVYSLGVLLYELLTGTTPFETESLRSRAFIEVLRIIREDDPPTPSARLHTLGDRLSEVAGRRQVDPAALQKLVRGDLDWIAMKALDKDRRRRYSTASEFADDIGRYFRDEPVTARKPSAGYRLKKFARRRRGMLLATASTIAAILLGGYAAKLGGLGPGDRSSSVRPAVMRAEPFTEVEAAIGKTWRDFQGLSPDGAKALIGDYTKGQNYGVYDFTTHAFAFLTDLDWSTHWVFSGAWSPRSDEVAYARIPWMPDVPVEIHVTTLDGRSRMIFRHDQAPGLLAGPAGWFPDGSKVLVGLARGADVGAIGTVPATGGTFTQIRTVKFGGDWNDRPALSPDGRFIAFAEVEGNGSRDIKIVTSDGRRESRVTDHAADDSRPIWSPDGRDRACISSRGGTPAVWSVAMSNVETAGAPFKIKDGMAGAWLVNWNARGIVYNQDTRNLDIFTSNKDGNATSGFWKTPTQLPFERTGRNTVPVWSPDSTQLAFVSREPSRDHVIVMPAAGGPAREYLVPHTTFPFTPADLRWFGNGRGLGFSGKDAKGNPALYRLTLATGEWDVLPLNMKMWTRIEWNDDGTRCYLVRLALETSAPGIYERDLATGKERLIHKDPEHAAIRGLRFSASRRWLAFTIDSRMVGVLNMATGERRMLATFPPLVPNQIRLQGIAWAPGDAGVAMIAGVGGRRELRLAALDGSGTRLLQDVALPAMSGPHSSIQGFDWSGDGRRIAFVVVDAGSDTFVLENPLADAPPRVTTAVH